MGRIFNNTNASSEKEVGGRINRGHGVTGQGRIPDAPKSQEPAKPPKKSLLKMGADFSERFLLRPWAGNAANFLIHAGQNIGEGAAVLIDPNVRKYANEATGASGQTRVRDVAAEAGKAALDLSTLATGGSSAAVAGATRAAPTVGKAFLAGGKAALPYGLAQGATEALGSDKPLLSLDSAKKVVVGGATAYFAGGTLAAGGTALTNALAKKAAAKAATKTATKAPAVADAAATASTYVPSAPTTFKTKDAIKAGIKSTVDDTKNTQKIFASDPQLAAEMVKNGSATTTDLNQRAGDMAQKMNAWKPGTGDRFLSGLKGKNLTSIDQLAAEANKVIDTPPLPINAGGKVTAQQNKQLDDAARALRQGGRVKQRGFITTIKESPNTPQAVKDIVSGSYVVKSNASLADDARTLIAKAPEAAEALALNPRNAVDVEVGNQLMAHYAAVGNHAKMAQIGEAMANSGTELGQAVQAFSQYDKTTPQGAIRFAQATIKQHNNLGKNIVKLTDDHIKSIYDAAAKIQEMPMGRERNIATHQLMEEVNNLIPSTVADKAVTVWKAGLLTSLRTTERNVLGNTLMAGAERAKDVPAAIAETEGR